MESMELNRWHSQVLKQLVDVTVVIFGNSWHSEEIPEHYKETNVTHIQESKE